MAFNNPASKFERAFRQFLIQQGAATEADCFIANDSRSRNILPNRTIIVVAFSPKNFFRSEGTCHVQIQHRFPALVQPGETNPDAQRIQMDAYLGDTIDSMVCGDGQSLELVADAITKAGRWLAQPDGTPEGAAIAQNNLDMANFRCDWIKQVQPFLTRGQSEIEPGGDKTFWAEILNFSAFVSTASIPN